MRVIFINVLASPNQDSKTLTPAGATHSWHCPVQIPGTSFTEVEQCMSTESVISVFKLFSSLLVRNEVQISRQCIVWNWHGEFCCLAG